MALKLYYIRHAQCSMNLEVSQLVGGRSNDSPLTPLGEKQSDLLGERLSSVGIGFDEVYSSPALRTRETAERSCACIGFPLEKIVSVGALQELDQGEWQGKNRAEIYTPEMLAHINSDNWNFCPPGGESQRDVEERQLTWLHDCLLLRYKEKLSIGIYGHGVALSCFLRGIMGFRPEITYKMEHHNTGITRLKYSERGWHVLCINDTSHLPFALRS